MDIKDRIYDDVVYVQLSRDLIEQHLGEEISDDLWKSAAEKLILTDPVPYSFEALERDIAEWIKSGI